MRLIKLKPRLDCMHEVGFGCKVGLRRTMASGERISFITISGIAVPESISSWASAQGKAKRRLLG